ncbi:PREDICTED: transmembrane protein 14A isoform X1 [Dipodomys ordii]|uniref:Transmembrane protein 14A isoform X1 n=1 Tax=Dipodomys ordii TaxID=10020 RepID=A0A1S3FDE3_DIPOR|nr:PREDICTED: transmembrane protein 14A isoform X1 [Dipodomys ordii]
MRGRGPWRKLVTPGPCMAVAVKMPSGETLEGSVVFLIAGLSFGLLSVYGAYRISNDQRDVKPSLYAAFFLATLMGTRFKRSKKVKSAGLLAGLSFLMILRLVLLLL